MSGGNIGEDVADVGGIAVYGQCDERFAGVRDAFASNFAQGVDVGASIAVTLDGEPVVDLWAGDAVTPDGAGVAADADTVPWQRDTIVNVWSTTKTMAATCMLMLIDAGEVELDTPVVAVWPEFGAAGKSGVLVRHVLGHTAGLSGFDPEIPPDALYDHDRVAAHLAAQSPWWEPGSLSGYHAITQGYLEGEIVRRLTGDTLGTFFRREIAEPLGADFHIGVPDGDDDRVGRLIPPPAAALVDGLDLSARTANSGSSLDDVPPELRDIAARTMLSCPLTGHETGDRRWRAAEIPAAGGTGNARSVSRVHSALACGGEVDGVRLMSTAGVERILETQAHNVDLVLGVKMRMGAGFGLMNELIPLSPNPRSFFWGGWGGSLAVIDMDERMTVSYVMNKMAPNLVGDLRGGILVMTAYAALAQLDR